MKKQINYLLLLFVCLLGLQPLEGQTTNKAIQTFVNNPALKNAGIGFRLIELSTGETIVSHNEDLSLTPASVLKIISTAAEIDLLGKGHQHQTTLYYSGNITEDGVLNGDLIIRGSGDPSLGSEFISREKTLFLADYLRAIRKAGIKQIKGKVVVDDLWNAPERTLPAKWLWEDIGNYYGPGLHGISVFDNTYRLTLKSTGSKQGVTVVSTEPRMTGMQFVDQVKISPSNRNDVYINGIPFSNRRELHGQMKEHQVNYVAKGDMPDPGMFLADHFRNYLTLNQVKVEGTALTTRLGYEVPQTLHKITEILSPTLDELIKVVNYRSNNHYVEQLYHTFYKASGKSLLEYWQSKGITIPGQFIYDACGLSPENAITATFMTDVLSYMYNKSREKEAFYASLPMAGQEGTVASFLKGTALQGKARIKSGSINNVQSYSGYIHHNGKQYAFALLVNKYTGTRADLRKQMETLLLNCL